MGLMQNGILGGFSGKVGTVVGGKWRGKDVMRSRPTKSKNAKKQRHRKLIRQNLQLLLVF